MSEFEQYIQEDETLYIESLSNNKGIVGMITAIGQDSKINIGRLFVKPEFRKQKIASQLHNEMLEWARERGYKTIELEIVPKNGEVFEPIFTVLEHFGYTCLNPQHKGRGLPLGYRLDI